MRTRLAVLERTLIKKKYLNNYIIGEDIDDGVVKI
jgi:hypothetical protein